MAIEITPGYDFQPTEVPTRDKFLQQALGVQISGIPLDRLQESVQAIVFGDTTGVSGGDPPAYGWIWVDPAGNRVSFMNRIFYYDGDGDRENVRTWRASGGWETSRLLTQGNSAGFDIGVGLHMWHNGAYRAVENRNDMDLDFSPWAVSAHNVASPATNTRLLCRGLGEARVGSQVTEIHLRTRRPGILTDATGQFGWRVLNQFDGFKPHFAGTVLGPALGACTVTSVGPIVSAWFVMRNLGRS